MSTLRPGSGQRRRPKSRGQSLVEFALILPIFLTILAGILDFGFMLNSRMTLINSTREGARAAVTQGTDSASILAIDERMTSAVCPPTPNYGWIRCNVPGLVSTSPTLTITTLCQPPPPPASQATCDLNSGGARDAVKGDYVRVTTTYRYPSFFAKFFGTVINISAQAQMVIE